MGIFEPMLNMLRLSVLFLFVAELSLAQEPAKLLFLNGKVLEIYNVNDSTSVPVTFEYDKNFFKKERIKIREARKRDLVFTEGFQSQKAGTIPVVLKQGSADRADLYAVEYPGGSREYYYFQDELKGNFLTREEMGAFIQGERDARYGVSGNVWFYSGLLVGGISGYLLESSVWSVAVPAVFTLGTQIPIIKIREDHISDKSYVGNENYALGYEKQARTTHAIQALKGSAIGTVLGIVAFLIVDNNR